MAAGQGSPRKGMKKSGRAKGSGGRKSKERSLGPRSESEGMNTGTSEQNPGPGYQQTQIGEGKTPGPQVEAALDVKGMTNPGPKGGQGRNESLSPTPGGVAGGQLLLSPKPPKRLESPLVAQYKDLRKTAPVDRHEVQASQAQSRRKEQRTIIVNRVRGDLEPEQEQSEGSWDGGSETNVPNDVPTLMSPQEGEGNPGNQDPEGDTNMRNLEGSLPMELE